MRRACRSHLFLIASQLEEAIFTCTATCQGHFVHLFIVSAPELWLELRAEEGVRKFPIIQCISLFASRLLSEHFLIVDGSFGFPGLFNIHKHFDPGQCVLVLNHYFLAQEALYVQWQAVLSFWS